MDRAVLIDLDHRGDPAAPIANKCTTNVRKGAQLWAPTFPAGGCCAYAEGSIRP